MGCRGSDSDAPAAVHARVHPGGARHALLNFAAFLFVHLPGFLQQLGAGEAQIGRIMAAQAVGAITIAPFAGRAMDSRGRRVVFLAGVGLFVAAVAMYLTIRLLSP